MAPLKYEIIVADLHVVQPIRLYWTIDGSFAQGLDASGADAAESADLGTHSCRFSTPYNKENSMPYPILAVLLGSMIAVASTGRFYPHYYQLLLPPLILAAAAGFGWASTRAVPLRFAAAGVLLVIAVVELGNTRLLTELGSLRMLVGVYFDSLGHVGVQLRLLFTG